MTVVVTHATDVNFFGGLSNGSKIDCGRDKKAPRGFSIRV